jgi:hypothetical protein
MSAIKISDLRPAGADLFQDSESFLQELGDNDLVSVQGGRRGFQSIVVIGDISVWAQTVFSANGNTINANTVGAVNTFAG